MNFSDFIIVSMADPIESSSHSSCWFQVASWHHVTLKGIYSFWLRAPNDHLWILPNCYLNALQGFITSYFSGKSEIPWHILIPLTSSLWYLHIRLHKTWCASASIYTEHMTVSASLLPIYYISRVPEDSFLMPSPFQNRNASSYFL